MLNMTGYGVEAFEPSVLAQICGGGDASGVTTAGLLYSDVKWGLYKVLDSMVLVDTWVGH